MNKTVKTLIASAVALTIAGAAGAAVAQDDAKEKCYGVVKAGMNDCANADKSHSCAGQSTEDGSAGDWIALPAGTCEKLVGGTTAPMTAEDMDHGHEEGESHE